MKGTIYRRFGDKKGLFTAMLRQGIKDLEPGLRAALDDTASPEQNLETIIFLVSVLEGAVIFGYRPKEAFGALLRDVVFNGIRTQQSKEISS